MCKCNLNSVERSLEDKQIKLSDISILSAHDVDPKSLLDFYKTMYPGRTNTLPYIWKWIYRSSFYENKIPLVILFDNRVIAHAGMIPFYVFLGEKNYKASWFIDFSVLPEYQRQGLGTILARKWMEYSDLCVEIGHTKQSGGVFKKLGWVESFDTYLHYYNLKRFIFRSDTTSISLFLRKILNIVFRSYIYIVYHKYASSVYNLLFDDLNSESLDKFIYSSKMKNRTVVPVRDSDYVSWRLLSSPGKGRYRVFSDGDVSFIIKLGNIHDLKYIDILWINNLSRYSVIRRMISTLAKWGMHKDYSYIRYYTSNGELSSYLSKSLKPTVKRPSFKYYSRDITLLEKLKHFNWYWELIDNDFEKFRDTPPLDS